MLNFTVFAEQKKIIVTGDMNYPPNSFINDQGEPDGFDVDLIKAVADTVNLEIVIKLAPWVEVMEMMKNGEADVIISIYSSESRDAFFDFTIPHALNHFSLYIPENSSINSMTDIESGTSLILPEGYFISEYIAHNYPGVEITSKKSNEDCLRLLADGNHDAAIVERMQGAFLVRNNNIRNIRPIDPDIPPRENTMAVNKGDEFLLQYLNEGLNILKQNGIYADLFQKWFGILENRNIIQQHKNIIILILLFSVLIPVLLLFWNRSLNRRVKIKTKHLDAEILQRIETETRLEKSLKEKETLLLEVHHRVKNNLQLMIGLIELQKDHPGGNMSEEFISNTQNRIKTIALIHEHLYHSQEFSEIDISAYITNLTDYIKSVYKPKKALNDIEINLDIPFFSIIYEKTIPLGLIISEILTNSIKHAFTENDSGMIYIRSRIKNNTFVLETGDNGLGYSEKDIRQNSLGLKLIDILSAQLGGELESSGANGTHYCLKIPLPILTEKVQKPL